VLGFLSGGDGGPDFAEAMRMKEAEAISNFKFQI
jgi:hypothetical protein